MSTVAREHIEKASKDLSSTSQELEEPAGRLTIGSVCRELRSEFSDISISKIRYLEDQKLVSPSRTPGGYRLYSTDDLSRLRTVLRAQRDMFLPLRVIRKKLASGKIKVEKSDNGGAEAIGGDAGGNTFTLDQIIHQTGATHRLVGELEEHGIVKRKRDDRDRVYDEWDRDIISAAVELARYGVAGKNLRVLKRSTDQEAALLEQILAPALRSKNEARRKKARDSLESLASEMANLKQHLLQRSIEEVINKKR